MSTLTFSSKRPAGTLPSRNSECTTRSASAQKWQPLEWDETQKTVEAFSAKRQRTDVFGEPYEVEEQFLRLRIPISAHSQLADYFKLLADYFKFGSSTTWMGTREPEWKFGDGVLIHEVEATEQAVQQGVGYNIRRRGRSVLARESKQGH